MNVEIKIHGVEQLRAKLRRVSSDVERKGARFAGRRAAIEIQKSIVRNAERIDDPDTAASIAKNIAVRFAPRASRRGDVVFRVGVLGGAKRLGSSNSSNPGGDTWYWRLLEFGTSKMRAQPFMRRGAESSVQAATDEFVVALDKWLDRYFKRTGSVPTDL